MLVIPDRGCALRRQVGRAVRADRRDVTQPLLLHDPLHVVVEHSPHRSRVAPARAKRAARLDMLAYLENYYRRGNGYRRRPDARAAGPGGAHSARGRAASELGAPA